MALARSRGVHIVICRHCSVPPLRTRVWVFLRGPSRKVPTLACNQLLQRGDASAGPPSQGQTGDRASGTVRQPADPAQHARREGGGRGLSLNFCGLDFGYAPLLYMPSQPHVGRNAMRSHHVRRSNDGRPGRPDRVLPEVPRCTSRSKDRDTLKRLRRICNDQAPVGNVSLIDQAQSTLANRAFLQPNRSVFGQNRSSLGPIQNSVGRLGRSGPNVGPNRTQIQSNLTQTEPNLA